MNCVVTTWKYFSIVLKGRLPPWQKCSQCLLFIASSRGLTVGWVGWGWQPLCENKQESGDALITAFIFHCRTPHVPVSAANSHPALLPQQHRNHHVGVLKTDFLSLLKPRDPAADGEPSTTHSSTTLLPPCGLIPLKSQRHSLRVFLPLKQIPLLLTANMKNLRWVLHSNAFDWAHFSQWLLYCLWARMSRWHFSWISLSSTGSLRLCCRTRQKETATLKPRPYESRKILLTFLLLWGDPCFLSRALGWLEDL